MTKSMLEAAAIAKTAKKYSVTYGEAVMLMKQGKFEPEPLPVPKGMQRCKHCGTPFKQHRTKKFCSQDCRKAYDREHRQHHNEQTCAICGKRFEYIGWHVRKYCSDDCARQGYYARKKERQG